MKKRNAHFLLQDAGIIALSVLVAIVLARTGVLVHILTATREAELLGSFIAGLFFTSIFTTAPAMVALSEIALVNSLIGTAFFGALGAVVGDLVIFRFVRDRLSGDILALIGHQGTGKRFRALIQRRLFRWFTFFLGGIVIASPLPDELGISLLGFSKMRPYFFVPFSFVFNFAGIYLIGLAARSLAY